MNLCYPDGTKSCAACCGLYNVGDATKQALERKLESRTKIFGETERTAGALIEFEHIVRSSEDNAAVDEVIHVCEFTGFLDEDRRTVGCLLHPTAPGNSGIDLRGLCHYGSMACKAFFCPASECMEPAQREIVVQLVDDWHLYGLVATDLDFVGALFRLVEDRLGGPLTWQLLSRYPEACGVFRQMLQWKNDWPFCRGSRLRRSRYYFKSSGDTVPDELPDGVERVLSCIRFTYGESGLASDEKELVQQAVERLVNLCSFQ